MNRSNNHLNCNSFIEKIDQYIKMVDWKEDVQTIEHLCIDISKNMNIIQSEVGFSEGREKFAALAKRIKAEFPEHEKAQEVAGVISCYVNAVFFNVSDVVKNIFSYLLPLVTPRYVTESGLRDVGLVSKSFRRNVEDVKKLWIQEKLISLKIYGPKTADEVVECILANDLKKINLADFSDFNETHLKKIAGSNIQSLIINCEGIKEWPKMDSLTHIKLYNVKDKDIVVIAKSCPNLVNINLKGEGEVTDIGVAELIKAYPNLTTINLFNTNVTDIGLAGLVKACPNLVNIDLGCTRVTDACVEALAKACPNLTTIFLASTDVTDVGLAALAKTFPNLTTIYLSGTKVTDVGVEALAKGCPNLTKIILYRTKVTDVGLAELKKSYPKVLIKP